MNVVKIIRPAMQPVKLIRSVAGTVRLVRSNDTPVRLEHTGGVVNYGDATDASHITILINLKTYYNLKKEL
jgi:hypothetical protein